MRAPSDQTTRRLLVLLSILIVAALTALGFLIGSSIKGAQDRAKQVAFNHLQAAKQAEYNHLHAESVLTCRRLNVTRSTDNQAHLQNYQLYQFLIKATKHETRAQRAKETRATKHAINRLRNGQTAATWTPLIDCTAPGEALKSLSLNPIPFTHRLPPKSALSPTNARRPDPHGSVS